VGVGQWQHVPGTATDDPCSLLELHLLCLTSSCVLRLAHLRWQRRHRLTPQRTATTGKHGGRAAQHTIPTGRQRPDNEQACAHLHTLALTRTHTRAHTHTRVCYRWRNGQTQMVAMYLMVELSVIQDLQVKLPVKGGGKEGRHRASHHVDYPTLSPGALYGAVRLRHDTRNLPGEHSHTDRRGGGSPLGVTAMGRPNTAPAHHRCIPPAS
jgi:hypothetical protein